MAISYPLSTPTTIGIESIQLRAVNAVSTSQSPFTYKQQIVAHQGQRWEASVSIPSVRKDLAADWKAFLVALKGQQGTFLLSDPDYATPRGGATFCAITGSAGDETVTALISGTLKAGDYFQLGTGSNAKLHTVLVDQTGNGVDTVDLEIWPALRTNYSSSISNLSNPKGLFRLANNMSSWAIDNASFYGISFEAVEVLV
jgi:hypothetical protein